MKLFRIFSIACAILFIHNVSYAEDWYQVEIVVFEYTNPNRDDIELWDSHPGEPDWKKGEYLMDEASAKAARKQAILKSMPEEGPPTAAQAQASGHEAPQSTSTDVPNQSFVTVEEIITGNSTDAPAPQPKADDPLAFVSLPDSQFSLDDVTRKLSRQGAYRILSHVAWRQPALSKNQSETVRITGGALLNKSHEQDPRYQFEGLVSLKTNKFLHLDVDAVLREPQSENLGGKYDSPADLGLLESSNNGRDRMEVYQTYRLSQSQRVRTNKLYYFDHPLMGMIVKISPYGG